MGDTGLERGLGGIGLVEVDRIIVTRYLSEHDDIGLMDRPHHFSRLAKAQLVEINALHR